MVVFVIQVDDFCGAVVDHERDAPVLRDVKRPCPFAVACELVRFPDRQGAQFVLGPHSLEEGQMMRIFGTASAGRPDAAPVSINRLSPLCLTFPIFIQNQSIVYKDGGFA